MISITSSASKKMQEALDHRGKGIGMRIGVRTSGCSGFAYVLEFADKLFEGDLEIEDRGITLIINKKDLVYLQGMEIDWIKKGLNEGFEFSNPNEKARCGCGESFTV
jgi:iron-sulfur cluster assembly protein